jgi:hypothetical protein
VTCTRTWTDDYYDYDGRSTNNSWYNDIHSVPMLERHQWCAPHYLPPFDHYHTCTIPSDDERRFLSRVSSHDYYLLSIPTYDDDDDDNDGDDSIAAAARVYNRVHWSIVHHDQQRRAHHEMSCMAHIIRCIMIMSLSSSLPSTPSTMTATTVTSATVDFFQPYVQLMMDITNGRGATHDHHHNDTNDTHDSGSDSGRGNDNGNGDSEQKAKKESDNNGMICEWPAKLPQLLWITPHESLLRMIITQVRAHSLTGITSIGCGSGLLEWLLMATDRYMLHSSSSSSPSSVSSSCSLASSLKPLDIIGIEAPLPNTASSSSSSSSISSNIGWQYPYHFIPIHRYSDVSHDNNNNNNNNNGMVLCNTHALLYCYGYDEHVWLRYMTSYHYHTSAAAASAGAAAAIGSLVIIIGDAGSRPAPTRAFDCFTTSLPSSSSTSSVLSSIASLWQLHYHHHYDGIDTCFYIRTLSASSSSSSLSSLSTMFK